MAGTNLTEQVKQQAEARRLILNEKLSQKESTKIEYGDYQAFWRGFSDAGRANVLHNGKVYNAKVLGSTSIALNANVKLTIAEYDFFVDW